MAWKPIGIMKAFAKMEEAPDHERMSINSGFRHGRRSRVAGAVRGRHPDHRRVCQSSRAEPIKIALFDFELDDFSAAAGVAENPTIAAQLKAATQAARTQLEASGRYQLVETRSSDAEAVKAHALRNCDGCDASIALKLGAQQSLVGLINKISMMEYTVTIQIRDAKTGAMFAMSRRPFAWVPATRGTAAWCGSSRTS